MTEDLKVLYVPLHSQFLIVLVVDDQLAEFRAYYVPVPGLNHAEEKDLWHKIGLKTSFADAAHFFPAQVAHLRLKAYTYAY